jgi:hypothetical protein
MINIGQKLYGYCNGYFGRDSYSDKRIEAIGIDWIVVRELDSDEKPNFVSFSDRQEMETMIEKWSIKPKEE